MFYDKLYGYKILQMSNIVLSEYTFNSSICCGKTVIFRSSSDYVLSACNS